MLNGRGLTMLPLLKVEIDSRFNGQSGVKLGAHYHTENKWCVGS